MYWPSFFSLQFLQRKKKKNKLKRAKIALEEPHLRIHSNAPVYNSRLWRDGWVFLPQAVRRRKLSAIPLFLSRSFVYVRTSARRKRFRRTIADILVLCPGFDTSIWSTPTVLHIIHTQEHKEEHTLWEIRETTPERKPESSAFCSFPDFSLSRKINAIEVGLSNEAGGGSTKKKAEIKCSKRRHSESTSLYSIR